MRDVDREKLWGMVTKGTRPSEPEECPTCCCESKRCPQDGWCGCDSSFCINAWHPWNAQRDRVERCDCGKPMSEPGPCCMDPNQ